MKMTIGQKYLAKEMRAYILASYVNNGETLLHDLVGIAVSYLSDTSFGLLDNGYTTECRLGMIFFTWCIVKLYFYVTFCSSWRILIVANYISHLGIKMISWSWGVGGVTKTSDFSGHIKVNCLFLIRGK